MKTNLEIEFKTLITLYESQRIREAFPFSKPKKQINVYFDTLDHQLYKKKMMCRIRIVDARYEFTLKIPQDKGVMEFECTLDSLSLNDARLINYFNTLHINALEMIEIARSETLRSIYSDSYGDWCLDETTFSHHTDYEIEYELHKDNKKAYPHYRDTLNQLNIEYKNALPKYIRALNSSQ